MSSIVEFSTFIGGLLMGNIWCYNVQEILLVNTLTTNNTFSIVLFALVDANYKFMFVDVGSQGRIADNGVVTNTELYKIWKQKTPVFFSLCLLTGEKKEFHTFLLEMKLFL